MTLMNRCAREKSRCTCVFFHPTKCVKTGWKRYGFGGQWYEVGRHLNRDICVYMYICVHKYLVDIREYVDEHAEGKVPRKHVGRIRKRLDGILDVPAKFYSSRQLERSNG
jgi:hypothetical protein